MNNSNLRPSIGIVMMIDYEGIKTKGDVMVYELE